MLNSSGYLQQLTIENVCICWQRNFGSGI